MLEENIIRLPITLSFYSFYNNSFSSYEALSQEGNYHEHKSAHTLQFRAHHLEQYMICYPLSIYRPWCYHVCINK